jgi:arylsulfatase A-like enzyme
MVHRKDLAARDAESFPHLFMQNGYHTTAIGKISHQGLNSRLDLPRSWSEVLYTNWTWRPSQPFEDNIPFKALERPGRRLYAFEAGDVDDNAYPDGVLAETAVTQLRKLKDQAKPFFLGVGFMKPHLPFNSPKKYWDMYDPEKIPDIPFPDVPEGIDRGISLHGSFELMGQYRQRGSLKNESYRRKLRHAYCAAVSYVDAQVGKVLDELDRLDLSKNTIVVLWGDHGWHLGDLGIWGKHTAFERALRSPLLVRVPGMNTGGQFSNALIESVDIYPTLTELCRLTPPKALEGRSFVNLLHNPKAAGPTEAFGYHRPWNNKNKPDPWGKTMRTDRYRFTVWTTERTGGDIVQTELYDHQTDSEESNNIAKERPDIVQALLKNMDRDGIPWNGVLND